MSTRSFSHLTHIVLAGALCLVLAGGVIAKPDTAKPSSVPEKRSADTKAPQPRGPVSTADKAAMERDAAAKAQGQSGYHYGDKNSKSGTGRPTVDYRPIQKPIPSYSQPAETRGKHDINYSRYPGRTVKHIPPTYRNGYYYYSSRPNYQGCRYGHWVFDDLGIAYSRKSVYFNYGYFPFVSAMRVHTIPYVSASYFTRPVTVGQNTYYLNDKTDAALDSALTDIRSAWMDGRFDLLQNRVSSSQMIAVLLDGRYEYSLRADDYVQMSYDAIDLIQTSAFVWERVKQRTDGSYTAFGKHSYYSDSRMKQTTYVSYTFRKIGGKYVITEVGSSRSPMS